jgi:hypothetical protein
MPGEGVNCSGSGGDFTAVMDASSYEILISPPQWNALAINDQGHNCPANEGVVAGKCFSC